MDRDRKSSKKAIIGIVVCVLLLGLAGLAMLVVRYYPIRHAEVIQSNAERYELEPALVFAVINAESRFNENAVSSAGASGLMQLMEDTAYWIAPMAGLDDFNYDQIFDPYINTRLGCFYLRMHIDRFGSLENALCAYNAGSGNVESWLNDPEYSSDGENLDVIPFGETHSYVERVMNYRDIYEIILRFTT